MELQTGYLVERESELPDAIDACRSIDPQECRKTAEQLFASDKMIDRHIETYHHVLESSCRKLQAA